MTRLAWLTDLHLNFLRLAARSAFLSSLADVEADAFLIGGDTGEAHDVVGLLEAIHTAVGRPVYFVLGNHDFYRGSIAGVRAAVRELCAARPGLHYLPDVGVVELTPDTALVGCDGWGDGRLGDYAGSDVMLNDWGMIAEFNGFHESKPARLETLHALADESSAGLKPALAGAAVRYERVVVLTHVPPFREACWHEGKVSADDWLPHFTCKAVGDVLLEAADAHPGVGLTVLCGHTHGAGEAQPRPNLRVLTGGAVYGKPCVQRVIAAG